MHFNKDNTQEILEVEDENVISTSTHNDSEIYIISQNQVIL